MGVRSDHSRLPALIFLIAAGLLVEGRLLRAEVATDVNKVTGETIYLQRCAQCHDHPHERIPPKKVLTGKTPAQIVQVLTSGVMQPMAAGLVW
jgi:mono/diheme cytochrome c family protein